MKHTWYLYYTFIIPLFFLCSVKIMQARLSPFDRHRQHNNTLNTSPHLSLEQAISLSFQNRPSLQEKYKQLLAYKRAELVPLSGYLPYVFVDLGVAKNRRHVLPKKQLDILFEQLLWSGSGPIQEYKIALIETEIATLNAALAEEETQHEVELAYFTLWTTQEQANRTRTLQDAATKTFKFNKDTYAVGLLPDPEWKEKQADFYQALSAVRRYPDKYNDNYHALEYALGTSINSTLALNSTHSFLKKNIAAAQNYPLDFYIKRGLFFRKEIHIKEQEIEREYMRRSMLIQSYLPDIFAQTTISNTFFGNDPDLQGTFWQVSLRLNWEFDGLANVHRASVADATILTKMIEKRALEENIILEIQQTYYTLQELLKQIRASQATVRQEKSFYERIKLSYKIGNSTSTALAQAHHQWKNAQFRYIVLVVQVVKTYRTLLFKTGYCKNI